MKSDRHPRNFWWLWLALVAGLPVAAQLQDKDLQGLRERGQREGWTFRVGHNEATKRHISELCNLREPAHWKARARFVQPPARRSVSTVAAMSAAAGSASTSMVNVAAAGTFPGAFDWRTSAGLPSIRNQGNCGSCWAFATVGALECAIKLKDGVTTDLSEQWLVSANAEGWGCNGGWFAHDYHLRGSSAHDPYGDNGAVPEAAFPYVAADVAPNGPYPHSYWLDNWAYIGGEASVPTVDQIKSAIVNYGPVAVGVYVNSAFQAYGGGVFNVNDDKTINHAVVLVGWDDSQGTSGVWLLRNSWGTGWGEGGYMRIEYGCCQVGYAANVVDYRSSSAMQVSPGTGLNAVGPRGGPFAPDSVTYTLLNSATHAITWAGTHQQAWTSITPASGTLAAGAQATVTVSLNSLARTLDVGVFADTLIFTNLTDRVFQLRTVSVRSGQRDYFTENFDTHLNDLDGKLLTFVPENSTNGYTAGCSALTAFPSDPTGGTRLTLSDDGYSLIRLTGGLRVPFFGTTYTSFYACANGYLTFGRSDTTYKSSTTNHFKRMRISALFLDLNPAVAGTVSWKQFGDHVAVTYQNIPEYNTSTTNNFQIELFTNGVIRLAFLGLDTVNGLAGLSRGTSLPADFLPSDLSAYAPDPKLNGLITLAANPVWGGSVTGAGWYPTGTLHTITATPTAGWRFTGWQDGNLVTNRNLTVTTGEVSYTASFLPTLETALDASNLTWSTGGDTNWIAQFTHTLDGNAAVQSAPLRDGEQAWLQTSLTGPGSIFYGWQVSSAAGDHLEFHVDGHIVERISGATAWKQRLWFIGDGAHTLQWRYTKDASGSAGADAAWLDQVQWLPCASASHAPQLFYQEPNGLLASWVLNASGAFQFVRLLLHADDWQLKAAGDLDGDGVSDLFFQQAAGDVRVWLLKADGSFRNAIALGNTGAWEARACADYLGVGRGQLFFQTPDGRVAYWQLDTNGVFQGATYLVNAGGWRLCAAGPGARLPRADLYWQTASGLVAAWRQQPGGGITAQLVGHTGGWALLGALDVDTDGVADLVWQTPAGDTAGWFMRTNATPRDARAWWNTGGWRLKAAGR